MRWSFLMVLSCVALVGCAPEITGTTGTTSIAPLRIAVALAVTLDALPYENVDLSTLYPFGTPKDRQ